jgi:hypothetical protein
VLRGSQVGGIMLVGIGALLLLSAIAGVPVIAILFAAALIGAGVWIITGATRNRADLPREQAAIPLEGAGEAAVKIRHGAGRLAIGAGAGPGDLLSGTFGGGLDARTTREGGLLRVDMQVKERRVGDLAGPWLHGKFATLDWDMVFSPHVTLDLELETGASESRIVLTDLAAREVRLKTGASATVIDLPEAAGFTRLWVDSGAASVKVRVPGGVAARIRLRAALAGTRVDGVRFPRRGEAQLYESADFETAANRVEIDVDTGVGSIEIS